MDNYKRFTERDEFGNAYLIGCEIEQVNKAMNFLAELEDKIEGGTLVDLNDSVEKRNYEVCDKDALVNICLFKDKMQELFQKRVFAARAVIDIIAEELGLSDSDGGMDLHLYSPDVDGGSRLLTKINQLIDKGGDKAKLKRRVEELEKENSILRSAL